MRRTLTIAMLLVVIATMAVTQSVYANAAISVGGGVTLTESAAGVSMGSRMDACRKSVERCLGADGRSEYKRTYRPITSWFSSTNMFPRLVMNKSMFRDAVAAKSPVYRAYSDFSNVEHVVKVELTPDHGATCWLAELEALKGYQVEIPYLDPGSYAFEWKVTSRDKKNRLTVVFLPFNWTSNRTNGMVQQVLVQSAPEECWNFTDEQWCSMLSPAFQPTTALPDPGYLAMRNAQRQTLNQMTAPAPIVQSQTPVAQPQPAPVAEPKPIVQPQPKVETPKPRIDMKSDGYAVADNKLTIVARPPSSKRIYVLCGEYRLILTGLDHSSFTIRVNGRIKQGAKVTFTRKGYEAATAMITSASQGKIYAEVESIGSKGL